MNKNISDDCINKDCEFMSNDKKSCKVLECLYCTLEPDKKCSWYEGRERLKLQRKIFDIMRKEILELEIRDWGHTAMIDHIGELAVRICDRISEDDCEML